MASELLKNLEKTGQYYLNRKDFRMHKIQNMIAIIKTIEKNPNIKIQNLLSIVNVTDPFMNKETAIKYLMDMKIAGQINIDKKTREVSLCA